MGLVTSAPLKQKHKRKWSFPGFLTTQALVSQDLYYEGINTLRVSYNIVVFWLVNLNHHPKKLSAAHNAVIIPVPSALLPRKMNDLFLFFIFFRFSGALSASWAHSTLNHNETLKPSDRCGQQFWPSSGKWTGATCQGDNSRWGKLSPSASFLLRDMCALLSKPMALLLRIPGYLCDETPLLECGVCTRGKVRYCEGLTAMSLSTIFRMPRRRIS